MYRLIRWMQNINSQKKKKKWKSEILLEEFLQEFNFANGGEFM